METSHADLSIRIRHLAMEHFRNYGELHLDFDEGISILSGPNAQGKTNLLEALYLLSSTRLLRGMKDAEAIQEGHTRAFASVELEPGGTTISVVLERGLRKRVSLNGMHLPRASDILGRLPCVCISSADLPIVHGEPSERRLFLDLQLSQIYPAYLRHLAVYKRAVEQRNALLKTARDSYVSDELFETWEVQMALHGAAMRMYRSDFISHLTPYAQDAQERMGSGEALDLISTRNDEGSSEEDLEQLLKDHRRTDIQRGSSSVGPHRDDFEIVVGGREGRIYGSQGQQRTAMLSIKLGTMELEKQLRGAAPLLLLDDVLSDLDANRRAKLMEWVLQNAGQTILTCTEASAAGPAILEQATVYNVREGTITGSL